MIVKQMGNIFIVGDQDTGKSVQLRSMFLDWRFGSQGNIPTSSKIKETIYLSENRSLHIRLTSPHEYGDEPKSFLDKIANKTASGRWNFAGAFQPLASNKMPAVVESVKHFIKRFDPERVRVCFLSPDRHGELVHNKLDNLNSIVDALIAIGNVEVLFLDARSRDANGLALADFFEFA
ncbi:MAG: hypothetical protein GY862_15130 [Gammaproteobacteria bacterium]|nr:hypothetical protein [Gammaproteobacteria bacterium]